MTTDDDDRGRKTKSHGPRTYAHVYKVTFFSPTEPRTDDLR